MENNKQVVTRIAPSPTGVLHIGTARTALFNYLYTKQNNGKFILRIEDTYKERSTKEFERNIIEGIERLGLKYDEFYRQSERTSIYKKYLEELIEKDLAYISKEEGGLRSEVIRLRNQNKKVTFNDHLRGDITFDTTELGDFVIAKSVTEPLYHLTVVVDDYEMGITHIIRGDDGISNTPRQILIQEAIGANTPEYVHLPLILGKDKSKLSKRHGATSMNDFWEKGYTTEAIINQLAFLGWNPGTEKEIFSMEELIKEFNLNKIQKGGAIFDEEKLNWFNRKYLQNIDDQTYLNLATKYFDIYNPNDDILLKIKDIVLERINVLSEIKELVLNKEFDYYFNEPVIDDISLIIWKNSNLKTTIEHIENLLELISELDEKVTADEAKLKIWAYAEKNGKGDVLWPLRYSLTGVNKSPDPFTILSIIGKSEAIKRLKSSLKALNLNN